MNILLYPFQKVKMLAQPAQQTFLFYFIIKYCYLSIKQNVKGRQLITSVWLKIDSSGTICLG